MKQIILTLVSLFCINALTAQNAIDRHFGYLLNEEDATHVNVTGKMFELMNSIDVNVDDQESQEEFDEMKSFLSSIRSFELIASNSSNNPRSSYTSGNKKLQSEYEELLSINDKEGSFIFYIDENNGTVHEVVGIGTDNEKMMVFSLVGDMRLEHIGKIAEQVSNSGLDQLSKVKDLNVDEIKVYPNPASSTGKLNLVTPEGFDGGIATMYNASGAVVETYKIQGQEQSLRISNLEPGNYILAIEQNGVNFKKKVLIID